MEENVRQKSVSAASQTVPVLTTERLRLRPIQPGDAPAVLAIYSDRVALEYFARDPIDDLEEAAQMVAEGLAFEEDSGARLWAVCLADTDHLIGTFTLFHISQKNRRAEVGYIFNREHWGKGYASEALKRMIEYCFVELDMGRLEADVDPDNRGSLVLLERNGFEREGYFRKRWFIRGQWYDSVMFGLLRPDLDDRGPG